jgi:hypothetical protein
MIGHTQWLRSIANPFFALQAVKEERCLDYYERDRT